MVIGQPQHPKASLNMVSSTRICLTSAFHLWELSLMRVIATPGKKKSPTISDKKIHSASIIPWSAAFAAAGWGWEEDLLLLASRNCWWTWPAPAWAADGEPLTSASADPTTPGSYPRYPAPAAAATCSPSYGSEPRQAPACCSLNPLCSIWEENDCSPGPSACQDHLERCLYRTVWQWVDVSLMLILYFSLQQSDSNGLDHHLDDDDVISDGVNPTDTDKSDGNARLAVTLSENNLLLN